MNMFILIIFLILYIFVPNSICASAEDMTTQNSVSTKIEEEICDQARQHMSPELAACNDLKCIENLLYKEEKATFDALLDKYMIPRKERKRFDASFADSKVHNGLCNTEYATPNAKVFQDKKLLGTGLVEKTREFLEKSGINPDLVYMLYGKDYFKDTGSYGVAQGITPYSSNSIISYDVDGVNKHKVKIDASRVLDIGHEVTHIAEFHSLKIDMTRQFFMLDIKDAEMYKKPHSVPLKYVAWRRSLEKHAELFPLLRYENLAIDRQFKEKYTPDCLNEYDRYRGTSRFAWNESPKRAVYPGCFELLPYMVRIEDIKRQTQKIL